MNTLNKVIDQLLVDNILTFTKDELDIAIQKQTEKILILIVQKSELLLFALTVLYLFQLSGSAMTKQKSKDTEILEFGISDKNVRETFKSIEEQAIILSGSIFDQTVVKKLG